MPAGAPLGPELKGSWQYPRYEQPQQAPAAVYSAAPMLARQPNSYGAIPQQYAQASGAEPYIMEPQQMPQQPQVAGQQQQLVRSQPPQQLAQPQPPQQLVQPQIGQPQPAQLAPAAAVAAVPAAPAAVAIPVSAGCLTEHGLREYNADRDSARRSP